MITNSMVPYFSYIVYGTSNRPQNDIGLGFVVLVGLIGSRV